MKNWGAFFAAVILAGCADHKHNTLGAAFEGSAIPLSMAQTASINSTVVVRGTMVEKCPIAGCWFVLRDGTGVIKVDTLSAGFVVVDVPLNTSLAVGGRVMTNGTQRFIEASGIRY